MSDYDIITVGGGLGGSSLAHAMARAGKRVLVLERETQYRDRVRGEGMTTWGVAEARELGIYDLLRETCAHELLASDDWDAAGNAYAAEHDRYFGVVRTVMPWMTAFFFDRGPEADGRRARAFPLIAQDPMRMPDALLSGPDHPVTDDVRQRFYAEV